MSHGEIQDIYALSPLQEGILFHTLYTPGSAVYVNQLAFTLVGELDAAALRAAWQAVADRHPVLRTSFHWEGLDQPVQVVHRTVEVPWRELNASGLPAGEELSGLERAELEEGFDFSRAPLMRLVLVRLAEGSHRLVWTHHHILLDGWSLPLVLGEVFALYEAARRGEPLVLPPVRPYGDYIAWLQEQDLGRAERFWRRTLQGFTTPVRLGAETGSGEPGVYRTLRTILSPADWAAVEAFCRNHRLTVSTLVLSAWGLLTGRVTGSEDVVFGATVSGRPADLPGVESMVGLFINTLPVRLTLPGDRRVLAWLRDLQEAQTEAREQEHIPLTQVQGCSGVPRGTPLFDSLVVYENYPSDALRQGPPRSFELSEVRSSESTGYPLTLQAGQLGGELSLQLTYDALRLEPSAAERLLAHVANLLVGLASRPDARIADVSPLAPEERHQLLLDWNDTERSYPLDRCLHRWIEDQVERSPGAVAVELDRERLTYRELDRRADRLAGWLRGRGVGPQERVAVCMERSLELVVSLLAVLKAGAAYVPLDPEYPRERLAFMLSDSRPRVLLVQERLLDRLPGWDGHMLCLDATEGGFGGEGEEELEGLESPDLPAYVIYTSGSTGRPKGVVVPHRGVCNRLLWMKEAYGLTPEDRVLQKTPFSFDVSVWEFFWPLMAGARLVLARPGGHRDGAYLADVVARRRITTLHFVPSMLQAFLEEPGLERCRSLKRVICSGEALPRRLQDRFAERIGAELHNLYGPTEASIDVTAWACRNDGRPTVPIGRPIANTRIYVLDLHLEPVPNGVAGELCIGGVGLACGYLGRADLTAERFIPDRFSSSAGERLYRTGDLVRWLADGSLDFLGRLDYQVKVRGFRIETGEIEAALCRQSGVREAVVVAREEVPGEKRLVAYLVEEGERPGIEDLRRALGRSLPDYMVPSSFVFLDALPLSPNGKVDRGALPAPEVVRPALGGELALPRTHAEEVLAAVWSRVLEVEPVGIDDNFFTLGGDSIRAIRVLALARERGLDMNLQHLFRHRTIRELAAGLEAGSSASLGQSGPFSLLSVADRCRLPVGLDDAYPLTLLQAGMLFHSESAPGEAVFHDVSSIRLAVPLQVSALRQVLDRLAVRHPVLRTSFDLARYGEPLQLVHAEARIPLTLVDLRALPEAIRERAVRDWIEEEKARTFDPARAPLLRYAVHALDEGVCQLTLGFHHAILDGWSLASLTVELFRTYFALLGAGTPDDSPPPAPLFPRFVALEREALASAEARRFWIDRLRDGTPTLVPRWPVPARTAAGGACRRDVPLDDDVSVGLLRLARLAGVPLKSVLLAAHLRVLSLLAAGGDVVTGVVSNGRPEETDGDRVLGLFLNTLPFRLRLPEGTWLGLVEATFEAEREALPFRRFPMAEVRRELGGQPLFEIAFVFVQFHVYRDLVQSRGLEVLSNDFFEETELPLGATFSLQTDPGPRVRFVLEHKPGELSPEEVTRIAGWYAATLDAMAADPEAPSETARLLSPAERHQLLVEWNDSVAPFPGDLCLHQRFEAQARLDPSAWAVLSEEGSLTYGELDATASRLARELSALGVGPDVPVGLCAERSPAAVVGLLAILKAGGAFVPLDPESPPDRLAGILEGLWKGLTAPVVLTQERLATRLPETTPRLFLDPFAAPPFPEPGAGPRSGVTPDHLAYVIHTSGSTGRPKGVMITHRAAGNTVSARHAATAMSAADRVLQNIHLTFDPSVWQCFGALTAGATLVLPRPGGQQDAAYLARLIEEHGVTLFDLPPSIFQAFIDTLETSPCRSLRVVFTGGEPLPVEEMEALLERRPVAFYNLYGPTETTIDATYWSPGAFRRPSLPIGRPALNKRVLVLDVHLQPVPAGVAGMVYITGEGLARGYLGRPDLTAEAFVPDAVTGESGARLYRTGDLARHLPDGTLEFAGRLDGQVKIRGRRVETGEIEAVLASYPGVRKVLVAIRQRGEEDRRLVAYVVPGPGSAAERLAADLRRLAREKLPEHMVPSAFVTVEFLPVRPSGKIDLAALPEPDWEAQTESAPYVAPRGGAEEVVAAAWAEALGLPRAGARDDFFAFGGHSLLALRVIARLRDAFGIEIPMRALFDAPTPAEMAARIGEELRTSAGVQAPPIERAPRDGTLPLSFAQQRLWFLDRFEPGSAAYNIPIALRICGPLDPVALRWSLQEIVRRHEVLRSVFPEIDGEPVQIVLPDAGFFFDTIEIEPREGDPEPEIARRAAEEARRPFDLARGPLLRATLLRSGEGEHALLLVLHHIVSDGWSIGVLFDELWTLYEAYQAGRPSPLPALPVQYADYAHWQREWLQEVLERQIAWWREHLGVRPPVLDLPTDRPRPAVRTSRGATVGFSLPAELTASLRLLARREGATLFMGLLSAFSALLFRCSGQDGVVVGTPIANRDHSEVEGLIGLFLNTLPFRIDLSGGTGFAGLLRRVRGTTLGAYAHQEVPFEKLVEELEPERDLSRTPLLQVMLVLQNTPAPGTGPVGLAVTQLPVHSGTAKFDLVLTFGEGRDDALGGVWEHSTDLFDPETVARMAEHFEVLLAAALAGPDLPIGALPLLRPAEREQLLAWSGSGGEVALEEGCLHRIFAARAMEKADAPAVSFEGEVVAYGDLDARANRLANRLRSLGVGPETLVGVCVDRTPRMLVALLGVLKAGGAYVPLDPEYPLERLAFLIEDARIAVLLTEEALLGRLPSHGARVVCLDRDAELLARESDRDPGVDVSPESLAYVIYTSGSTGRPKGVPVPHARVACLFSASRDLFGFGPDDVWTLFHSFAFDFSVWEIWGALLYGGRLVVVPFWISRSPDAFLDLLRRERVTVLNQTPSAFRQLIEFDRALDPLPELALRLVVFGGEALDLWSLRPWFERRGDRVRLVNMYGITETTVHVTFRPIQPAEAAQATGRVIGRALPHLQLLVLDGEEEPAPIGVAGEVFVGGAGLARGYFGRPDLTAERFLPNPFGPPGSRLYRSGDLARWLPGGDAEYLGRADHQVKVRGFRIELGEIEAVLGIHPGVRQAVLLAREDEPGQVRLVAYVVAGGEPAPTVSELRAFAAGRLPEYMLPAAVVFLESLPLTAHGKVDRRALPAPDRMRPQLGEAYEPPRTPVERDLTAILAETLGLDRVGIRDNFFDLGGQSLLAVKVVACIREAFGVDLPLRVLFGASAVADLAYEVARLQAEQADEEELASLLAELEEISEDEAAARLGEG